MGLIKAAIGAVGGVLADQWKEFFYCEALDKNVLMTKGVKKTSSRSSNTKGEDNIISNGSGISIADGQCMMIVEQGKIVEFCAEPGEFTYDSSTEASIFAGSFGEALLNTFKTMGKRFTYGGDTAKDQRIYYFNTKEIMDNKFGTASPIPFRVVISKVGLDLDTSVRCSGIYSFKISDPMLFYKSIAGNVASEYTVDDFGGQLKTEFVDALQPAFASLCALELRPSEIPGHKDELIKALNDALESKWGERGLKIVNVAMNPLTLPEEDQETIKLAQRNAMYTNVQFAAATMTGATADAMNTAAGNSAGAITGFMGMGMAQNNGANIATALFQQAAAQQNNQSVQNSDSWKCSCGATVNGNFCTECGAKRPAEGWTCKCGQVNKGKFCSNCGEKKPANALLYKCDKCGWEPKDPTNPPKFCPECGDIFDDKDIK